MPQAGEPLHTVASTFRLLPGDEAPGLRFTRTFNRAQSVEQVSFDRPSAVILWNAGCAGCLPIVGEVAELGAAHGVPCYGVAVMVRDVERTATAAASAGSAAVLALEERPSAASALARGPVTRQWLEASGQQGVPAAFLIDGRGVVAWVGDPGEIHDVLPAVVGGTWDVDAARQRWRATVADSDVAALRLTRDATDALAAGETGAARALIAAGEAATPAVAADSNFNLLKLHVLAAAPAEEGAAVAHYVRAAGLSPDDPRVQSSLAAILVKSLPGNLAAMNAVREQLARFDGIAGDVAAERILCQLLLAEAAARVGAADDATSALDRIAALAGEPDVPGQVRTWALSEIERLRRVVAGELPA